MPEAFYTRDADTFVAGPYTRGPWDNRFQHGGPPAALLAGAMARFGPDAEAFALARVTVELLRPVPIARFTIVVRMERTGRTVQRLLAELQLDGKTVVMARGLRVRRVPMAHPTTTNTDDWPAPAALERFVFPFFQHDVGYHQAVDLRIAGGNWGTTPIRVWTRPLLELVADRPTLPIERVMIIADAQSGMGIPLDPGQYTFVNPDLTVYLDRHPVGDWLGFDIRSSAGPNGVGLSQSAICDQSGEFGRSAQSLVVAKR